MKKILVYSYYYENFKEIADITQSTIEEYCKIQGYDFFIQTKDFDHSKGIGFERIKIALEKLQNYDWLWYLDIDTMIMNQTIRLENIVDENYDIIISKNPKNKLITEINIGSILIKKTEWTRNFLEHINNLDEYYHHDWKSQQAIIDYINITHSQEVEKHIKLVNPRFFNSFYHEWFLEENFQIGDFVLHPAGSSNDYRIRLFNEMKNKIIKKPKDSFAIQPYNGYN